MRLRYPLASVHLVDPMGMIHAIFPLDCPQCGPPLVTLCLGSYTHCGIGLEVGKTLVSLVQILSWCTHCSEWVRKPVAVSSIAVIHFSFPDLLEEMSKVGPLRPVA